MKSVDIDEKIVSMGVDSKGEISPPAKTTMWYNQSPKVGSDGISVIAGHVTYDGPDNFYNLDHVANGAPVDISCQGGKTLHAKVTHSESIDKQKLTTDARVWGTSTTPVIALITCDRHSPFIGGGHHKNNYVVWATPTK